MSRLYEVSRSAGYENPHVYVESPAIIHRTYNGWLVEDVITGYEKEFTSLEDAEGYASDLENWYDYGPDSNQEGEY